MLRFIVPAVAAILAIGTPDTPAVARDTTTVIQTMLSDIGDRRPANCPGRWCACYMDDVLARVGLAPLGSNLAQDFAAYGAPAQAGQVGAIMVMRNHVGVVVGRCEDGDVQIISGNHSNQVALGCYDASRAIAWRAPSSA